MEEKDIDVEKKPDGEGEQGGGGKEEHKAKKKEAAASLKEALAEEKKKAEDYLANWQRSQADFVNFKRRTEQERSEVSKLANAALMLSMLPILDDMERALGNVSDKLRGMTWVDGIELIYRKLKATLEGQGLSEIKALGETFDPNFHEAVVEVEGEEGKVVGELQKGYMLNDRVLRPTMVQVGRGDTAVSKEEVQEENNG